MLMIKRKNVRLVRLVRPWKTSEGRDSREFELRYKKRK